MSSVLLRVSSYKSRKFQQMERDWTALVRQDQGVTIGKAIKERREGLRILQKDLASTAKVPPSALSRFENDQAIPDDEVRERIESALGLARGQLLVEGGLVDLHIEGQVYVTMVGDMERRIEEVQLAVEDLNAIMEKLRDARESIKRSRDNG